MISTLILVALSAVSGFVIGRNHFPYHAMLAAAVVLAPLSAVILQNQGFGAISGIFTIVSCLTLNQVAYVIGVVRANSGPEDLHLINKRTTYPAMVATTIFAANRSGSRRPFICHLRLKSAIGQTHQDTRSITRGVFHKVGHAGTPDRLGALSKLPKADGQFSNGVEVVAYRCQSCGTETVQTARADG